MAAAARDVHPSLVRAIDLFKQEKFEASHRILLSLSRQYPENALVIFNLGNAQFMMERYESAMTSFEKVEELQSPLAPVARLYRAKCLLKLERTEEARKILKTLAHEPLPPGLHQAVVIELETASESAVAPNSGVAERALEFYRAQRYDEALLELDRAMVRTSELQLLRAMILMRLNRPREARYILRKLSQSPQTPADTRRSARDLLVAFIERGVKADESWLFLDLGGGINSNPFSDPESAKPSSRGIARLSAGGGYHFFSQRPLSVRPGYTVNFDETAHEKSLRSLDQTLQTPIFWQTRKLETALTPFYNHVSWADSAALQRVGARLHLEVQPRNWSFGTDAEWAEQKNLQANLDYLKGKTSRLRAFVGASVYPVFLQLTYDIGRDDVGDLIYTDAVLPLANHYQGPGAWFLWRMNSKWNLSGRGVYLNKKYQTLAQPGGKARIDHVLTSDLRVTRMVRSGIVLYLDWNARTNVSTLGPTDLSDKNYRALSTILGISLDVL